MAEDAYSDFGDSLDNQSNSSSDIVSASNPAYEFLGFVCSVAMIVVGVLGVVGNAAAIRYFGRKSGVRSTVSVLLTALSTFDLILLSTGTPIYSILGIYSFDGQHSTLLALAYCMTTLYPFSNIAQMGSVWTMTLISVERYVQICHTFFARRNLTVRKVRICVISVAVVSTLYNACRFWEYAVNDAGLPEPYLRKDPGYLSIYVHWMYFVFVFCLPFFVIVIFNCLVAVGVRRAMLNRPRCQLNLQQRKERRTTLMLLVVVCVFVFCNSLSWPLNAYETFGYNNMDEAAFDFLSDLNNLLVLSHPTLNIFVYMYFSSTFRRQCLPGFFQCLPWRSTVSAATSSIGDASRHREPSMTGSENFLNVPLVKKPVGNYKLSAPSFSSGSKYHRHSSSISLMHLEMNGGGVAAFRAAMLTTSTTRVCAKLLPENNRHGQFLSLESNRI